MKWKIYIVLRWSIVKHLVEVLSKKNIYIFVESM